VRLVQSASRVSALVIDADPEAASTRRRALERAGYDVQVAATAGAGADQAQQEVPALVVLAATLPDADPVDVVRLLREDARTRGAALLLDAEVLLCPLTSHGPVRSLTDRSDFLSTVSHELRTPLTAIRGFSEWLVDEWETAPDPQRLEMVQRIMHAGGRLDGLVNDLLDFSRLERGGLRVTLAPVALSAVVRTTVADLGFALEQHKVELRLDDALVVMADEPLLSRAVENLLTNAAKFSPAGSTVLVRTEARPGAAVVVVRDEGMGIPEDEQGKVFDRFYRVPETATHHPGTGVGLAIVQQFVEAQGGSVTLRSQPGKGAEFTLRLVAEGAVP
jgi:signal transduction histidine kinase